MASNMLKPGAGARDHSGGRDNITALLLFAAGTFLLYFSVLGNSFLTDDYAALYRISIEKRMLHEEFLRPLIDISFYLNYCLSGLHPAGYYIFNFCIHALTCYMVYRLAILIPIFTGRRRYYFAWMAGFLFLVYPFHNEAVVWLSGRLSSMAALCGLLAVYCHLRLKRPLNFVLAALCWLVGLFAYESIILLPLMILLLDFLWPGRRGDLVRAAGAWGAVGTAYLVMRWMIAGTLVPGYGMKILTDKRRDGGLIRMVKVTGRCILPPMEDSHLMTAVFVIAVVGIAGLLFLVWRRTMPPEGRARRFLLPVILFFLALAPAFAFGVSTRTSEGDRLLYYPSIVLSLIAAGLISGSRWRWVVLAAIAVPGILFIQQNNRRWVFASRTATALLDTLKKQGANRVFLVNVPDEWEGAFIFRNNFNSALTVNAIDTNKVVVNNFLMRLEYLGAGRLIDPVPQDSGWFIYPFTHITVTKDGYRLINIRTGVCRAFQGQRPAVYYWDKLQLKQLTLK